MSGPIVIDAMQELTGHCFEGVKHGDVPVSFFMVWTQPGRGPRLHSHPYAEVWALQEGQVTFRVGDQTLETAAEKVVIVPAGQPHAFKNTGTTPLRMVCIHPQGQMETEWLEADDGHE